MSLLYFIIVIGPSYFVERRLLKRPGYISFASASLAGVALSIPAMAAASNSALEPYVTQRSGNLGLCVGSHQYSGALPGQMGTEAPPGGTEPLIRCSRRLRSKNIRLERNV